MNLIAALFIPTLAISAIAIRYALKDAGKAEQARTGFRHDTCADFWYWLLDSAYPVGGWVVGIIAALAIWGVLAVRYGMWGVLLGWMPAGILFPIAAALWPLALPAGLLLWFIVR
jgi:hypothetical protein